MNLLKLKFFLLAGIIIASAVAHADYSQYKKYANQAKIYYKEKDYKNAAEFFLKAEKQSYDANSLAGAMVSRGNCLILLKDHKLAGKIFQTVISNPETPLGYKSGAMKAMGLCLIRQNNYDAAQKILQECLKNKDLSIGTRQEALWLLGGCFYDTGKFSEAEKVYLQMLTLKKLSPAYRDKAEKRLREIKEFK